VSGLGLRRIQALTMLAALSLLAAVVTALWIMPSYQSLRLRTKFSAVVSAAESFKTAIELCAKFGPCAASGALSGLEEGTLGIPHASSGTYLASVRVASNGTITATATKAEGLAGETYVLTPRYVKGEALTWAVSGTCKTRPEGAIC